MKVTYLVEITDPKTHMVNVRMDLMAPSDKLEIFLPSWSPGSYLMREYSRNVRNIKVLNDNGEHVYFSQIEKGTWQIDLLKLAQKKPSKNLTISYEVYCHELTVRTSHIDESHAFLHGPSYLMGVVGQNIKPTIEFRFPALWSKLHTPLKDISTQREVFVYEADDYDVLVDAPVEIGCHESDGFMAFGKEHHLIWYGQSYPHKNKLKEDIKTIVETVGAHFEDIPYDHYMFMTHLKKNLFGGLEHLNSTALQFDGRKLGNRDDYVFWLALVAHEYFHTWNVKRIRPIELGPFDYRTENYTSMHWLTEGLTSFMDELFVLRSGLCTLEEYLKLQTKNISRYESTPGKKFDSLEASSFNAWIKLYRPDENSNNSSVSYYLKGGLVFSTLHFELKKVGKNINDFLHLLWKRYKENPDVGLVHDEVMSMVEELGGKEVRELFELRITTTEDIDLETYYNEIGLEFEYNDPQSLWLGFDLESGERATLKSVTLDGPAFKSGLNAGDEILAINSIRILSTDLTSSEASKILSPGQSYKVLVARMGELTELSYTPGSAQRILKSIKVIDRDKALKALKD